MKIILTQDVPKLGSLGDELDVKPGFARNYLIPQGKAVMITRANIRQVEHRRAFLAKKREDAIESSKATARRLEEAEIVFYMKSGESGKLFGSVTQKNIGDALEELGIELDRKKLHLSGPIKSVGNHFIDIKLHTEVIAELKIQVRPEKEEEEVSEGESDDSAETASDSSAAPAEETEDK